MIDATNSATFAVDLANVTDTALFGAVLASVLCPGDVVVLNGPLGAGKTTLVKSVVEAFSPGLVATSPTFALCHLYPTDPVIAHVDCWRLKDQSELEDLGLEDVLEDGAIALIEWGELARERFLQDGLVLDLEPVEEQSRLLRLAPAGSFTARLSRLVAGASQAGLSVRPLAART